MRNCRFSASLAFWKSGTNLVAVECLTHHTKGRQLKVPFVPSRDKVHPVLDLYDPSVLDTTYSGCRKERRLAAETNNGRLSTLGLFGFICANKIPGLVPLLDQLGAVQGWL
jgi:hypothetical protein